MSTKTMYVQVGKAGEPMVTVAVESKVNAMRHHRLGLSWTASGYGSKIPTEHMVQYDGRWRRVYCAIYSNCGTCYILIDGNKCTVSEG
ncbi:hypothetical protein Kompost2_00002 [Pseudomonas phage vB_PpuP-Kompost-2]